MPERYAFIPKHILIEEEQKREATLKNIARKILPPPARAVIRSVLFNRQRPLLGTYQEVEVAGIKVEFIIKNKQDVWRLHAGFEAKFSQAVMRRIQEYPKDSVFYNVGAAQGFYTTLAAAAGARVWAFEPDPENYESMRANLTHNHLLDRVSTQAVALGRKNGTVTLYTEGVQGAAPSLANVSGKRGAIEVPIMRLDDVVASNGHSLNGLFVDVEGAELDILEGASGLLQSPARPQDIFIEIHPRFLESSFGTTAENVWNLIQGYNYTPQFAMVRGGEIHAHFSAD